MKNLPSELSSGEKQRIAVIQSLASCPELLLFDEAFSAINPHTKQTLLSYLADYIKQQQLSAVYISHDINELNLFTINEHFQLVSNNVQTGTKYSGSGISFPTSTP